MTNCRNAHPLQVPTIPLNREVILQFFGAAVVGAVEWWFRNGMPVPPRVMAEQTGILLDRNL
ncbi:TetR-like C-terminal domain-containing protein [Paenibacillus rhizosphaerae]|uniref:TetR-like C-terminal domain-containing protein n=1 Tax=Paenibacillus rhizosphaerae TaxID=297318 RepID=UPI00406BD88C